MTEAFINKKQIQTLEDKDWEVIPRCKFLNLYPEDFSSHSVYQELCDVFNKQSERHLTLLVAGVKSSYNNCLQSTCSCNLDEETEDA